MDQGNADLVVKWYVEMETRLTAVLRTVPYGRETESIFLPPLANIVLDACSLLDAVFRAEYCGSKNRDDLTMPDYSCGFEPKYGLSQAKSVVFQHPLGYVFPFRDWYDHSTQEYRPTSWWKAYNALKHDRINAYQNATLANAVLSLCALHQAISQMETFADALLREDMVCFGNWNPAYAREVAYNRQADKRDVTILVETDLFATPVGVSAFPEDISRIDPWKFGTGKKLWRFVGRQF
jgi:hypothetical protein